MTNKFTVLVIEDEKSILDFIAKSLTTHDYKVIPVATGREALSLITSLCPDVILLDLGLPDMDGTEIIKSVRTWSDKPIIVISARSQENDKVQALDLGADDYITKPFGIPELLARLRASLRHSNRMHGTSESAFRNYHGKDLSIDFIKRSVSLAGDVLHLTPMEYKIVAFLAQNSGRVMTYSSIMEHVWGPFSESDNKILRVNMANIRRKLEKNPAEPVYIFTEVGIGYRMLEDEGPAE